MPDLITLTQADFNDGPDNGSAITAGATPGEVANAEVGDTGQLADYEGVEVGQPAQSNTARDVAGNEVILDLDSDNANTQTDDATQVRFIARKRQNQDGTALTPYIPIRNARTVSSTSPQLFPSDIIVSDGRLLAIQTRNPNVNHTVSFGNSIVEVPAIGYDKSEL